MITEKKGNQKSSLGVIRQLLRTSSQLSSALFLLGKIFTSLGWPPRQGLVSSKLVSPTHPHYQQTNKLDNDKCKQCKQISKAAVKDDFHYQLVCQSLSINQIICRKIFRKWWKMLITVSQKDQEGFNLNVLFCPRRCSVFCHRWVKKPDKRLIWEE